MDTLSIVALAGLCAVILAAAWAGYRLWRAVMRDERPVLMHRVLEREGLSLAGSADAMDVARAAVAIRRCVACRERETCLAWLEGEDSTAFQHFCPNASLMAELKAQARGVGASR